MPKTIVHLTGPRCSGKTFILNSLSDIAKWDVEDVYCKYRKSADEVFPPNKMRDLQKEVVKSLKKFVEQDSDVLFVESSGNNRAINNLMARWMKFGWHVVEIWLEAAIGEELAVRMSQRGLTRNSINLNGPSNRIPYTQKQAMWIINNLLMKAKNA